MAKKINRIYIEIARTNDHNRWEIDDSVANCKELSGIEGDDFFTRIIDNARYAEGLLESIEAADEIYMSTAIVPLVTYTKIGSPDLWNTMMATAITRGWKGKKVFNEQFYRFIQWDNLNKDLLDKAFKDNYLYVMDKECNGWEQVDIDTLLREKFKNK